MGSLALIAKTLGHQVSGQDQGVYPPMSTQLDAQGIYYQQGYQVKDLPAADLYIIGNALSRGNACVEEILSKQYTYTSGAQWLSENVLSHKWVLAVSGTHGKTTTASMLAWILESAGLNPGFLIGGVAQNFGVSSRLTDSPFFVIEADEYDTAFFDKRSKFVHYHPNTLVINNLEFDHADIFGSLADIQKQFHHLLRIVPNNGLILYPANNANIEAVIEMGCYTPTQALSYPKLQYHHSGSCFELDGHKLSWSLLGEHNMQNAVNAIYAAHHAGVPLAQAYAALAQFAGVKRRLEVRHQDSRFTLYDDFAHHPSAIATTLEGLRAKVGDEPICAVLELRSNTMKMGHHQQSLIDSLTLADRVLILKPDTQDWDVASLFAQTKVELIDQVDTLAALIAKESQGHVVVMSNGGFGNLFNKVMDKL